jgi:hypothetical protein
LKWTLIKSKNGYTLSSTHRAHPCSYLDRRLRAYVNAHTTAADSYAADAYCGGCRANESTANCRTDRRAADAHRAACCVAKSTPNQWRNANANKTTDNQ